MTSTNNDDPTISAVIWDVDGTLADTIALCVAGLQKAIVEHGGPQLTATEVIERFGPTEEGLLRDVVGDRWTEAIERYLELYRDGHHDAIAFDGVPDLILSLAARGVPMAVVTGKGVRSAAITLDALGLSTAFDEVAAGSMNGSIKAVEIRRIVERWGLPAARVGYVGDMPSDVTESRKVGVVPLIAAWKPDADPARFAALDDVRFFATATELGEWLDVHLPPSPGD